MKPVLALALISAAAALAGPAASRPAQSAAATFDPIRFFAGRTEGLGKLKVVLKKAINVRFTGVGRVQSDGSIILDQHVQQDGKPDEWHRWHMRAAPDNRYTGTVSTARGPIVAERTDTGFRLRYTDKDGYAIDQSVTPAPDGRTATIRLKARKLGIVVATMEQQVRRLD